MIPIAAMLKRFFVRLLLSHLDLMASYNPRIFNQNKNNYFKLIGS